MTTEEHNTLMSNVRAFVAEVGPAELEAIAEAAWRAEHEQAVN